MNVSEDRFNQLSNENVLYKEKIVYQALEELDERLYQLKVHPFTLNVVGGFALTVEQIRLSDFTDIDYVGKDFPESIKEIIDEIGIKYKLGRGWINNDVIMGGGDISDLEVSTGTLIFNHAFDLRVITVNTLDREDILKMKLIALDTSYAGSEGLSSQEIRIKDFIDIDLLMKACGFTYNDVVEEYFDYILSPEIFFLIRYYLKTKDLIHLSTFEYCQKIIANKGNGYY